MLTLNGRELVRTTFDFSIIQQGKVLTFPLCALLKEIEYKRDVFGRELSLYYLRNKDGDEIDFAVVDKQKLTWAIEAKWSDDEVTKSFFKLVPKNASAKLVQLVGKGPANEICPLK